MAGRHDPGTLAETKLAHVRMSRGVTQEELAEAVGISVPTYRLLERGQMPNPKLAYLVNCAIALDVELDAIIEDEWLQWQSLNQQASEPPEPDEFWRRPYRPK
jgi:transcriptional regulator with XRE-family HTH domain